MPRKEREGYPAGEAARLLGISIDTLRRWDRQGRIGSQRDSANRRIIPASEIDRLLAERASDMSARNRLTGVIKEIKREGLVAQVELQVTEPARVVAIITADAVDELGLQEGMKATAVVKATSVMIQR